MFRSSRFIVAGVIAIAALASAQAAEGREVGRALVSSVRVNYGDLDLSDPDDSRALLGRIEKAAFQACGGDPRHHVAYKSRPQRVTQVYRECRDGAVARAVAEVDAQGLWLAFRLRNGEPGGFVREARS